jgi:hypothetical protein
MKEIRILFHRSRGPFAWLIRWWTRSSWAHVQVGFDGDQRLEVVHPRIFMAKGGDKPGAVWTCQVTLDEYHAAYAMASVMVGMRYDWKGIVGQAAHVTSEKPGAWFCSEAAAAILQAIGKLPATPAGCVPEWYSPDRLARALIH